MSYLNGGTQVTLLSGVTGTGAGSAFRLRGPKRVFQATGQTSSGAGSATVAVQGSLVEAPTVDGDWVDLGTITLTLSATRVGDGFVTDAPWLWLRGNATAISGTGAAVTLYAGAL